MANISLPLALIIIGGSISPAMLRKTSRPAIITTVLKMLILPGIAFLFYRMCSPDISRAVPAMVLLATPTAITTYIMARELGGREVVRVPFRWGAANTGAGTGSTELGAVRVAVSR